MALNRDTFTFIVYIQNMNEVKITLHGVNLYGMYENLHQKSILWRK